MLTTYRQALTKETLFQEISIALLGSLIMVAASKISLFLPGNPVPITMQTFGVFIVGLVLGPKRGALSVIAFLVEACAGLPVLSEGVNPLWIFGPRAGYLVGFIFASYAIGILTRKSTRTCSLFLVFLIGDVILFSLGILVLSFFVGAKNGIQFGLMTFVVGELYKISAATLIAKGLSYKRNVLSR